MRRIASVVVIVVAVAVAGLTSSPVRAQGTSAASVTGVVKDSSGAVLPGATWRRPARSSSRRSAPHLHTAGVHDKPGEVARDRTAPGGESLVARTR